MALAARGDLEPTAVSEALAKRAKSLHEIAARIEHYRPWHVSFDYYIRASGQPMADKVPAEWFPVGDLPPTMHGNWETETIDAARSPHAPTA